MRGLTPVEPRGEPEGGGEQGSGLAMVVHARSAEEAASARGCSSMAEHQLPKLTVRVRFPSPAQTMKGSPMVFGAPLHRLTESLPGIGRSGVRREARAPGAATDPVTRS